MKKIFFVFLIVIIALSIKNARLEENYKNTMNTYNQTIFQLQQNNIDIEQRYNRIIQEKENTINQLNTVRAQVEAQTSRSSVTREEQKVSSVTNWIQGTATAYCPCKKCCGKTNGITASGAKATANHTIAAPSNYPFGTKIEIENYGIYVVEDRGGAIKNNKIDIFMNTHQEALKFGKHQIRFRIVE